MYTQQLMQMMQESQQVQKVTDAGYKKAIEIKCMSLRGLNPNYRRMSVVVSWIIAYWPVTIVSVVIRRG